MSTIRVAAVGDIHLGLDSIGSLRPALADLAGAEVLLLAGDLTRVGSPDEAVVVAAEVRDLGVPVVAVLGNHDVHSDAEGEVVAILTAAGIAVLDGTGIVIDTSGGPVGIAGVKGFGVGFPGATASCFGEAIMKDFVALAEREAAALDAALDDLPPDLAARIALTHYAPAAGTLRGEPPEIHAFLGSYLLGEVIDRHGVDLAVHGHAHRGTEKATTPGGTPVRNVAWPVTQRPFVVYGIDARQTVAVARPTA